MFLLPNAASSGAYFASAALPG